MNRDKVAIVTASAAASLLAGLGLASTNVPLAQTEPVKDLTVAQALPSSLDQVNIAMPDSDGSPYPPKPSIIG
jgi:hypothetical protein